MLDRTELILSQRKIPALSNPARLSLVSRPTTTIDKSHLSFSLPLPLSFSPIFSPFIPPSLRILLILSVCLSLSLPLFEYTSVRRGKCRERLSPVEDPSSRGRVSSGQSRIFEQQSSAARRQRRVSSLRVHAWTEHTVAVWFSNHRSMIRSSGFTLGAYSRFEILARALLLPRSLASRRSALVDLQQQQRRRRRRRRGVCALGPARSTCGYIWRGVPRKNSSSPGTKLGGGRKMEAPG